MRILLLAPEPFYEDRGTPIAVALVLRVLSERGQDVDVLTYHLGRDLHFDRVTLSRIPAIPLINDIRPGFSWKKVICDVFLLVKAIRMAAARRYHLVHAVEESVFIALTLKWLFKVPYLYDMDSSLAEQLVGRFRVLRPLAWMLRACEALAVRRAKVVVPVCQTLAELAARYRPEKIVLLPDVSLVDTPMLPASEHQHAGSLIRRPDVP